MNRMSSPLPLLGTNYGRRSRNAGFTLLELVLATLISSLVIGILSVCLAFTLRVWESRQNVNRSDISGVIDIMRMQLAHIDLTPVRMEGATRPIFKGEATSMFFVTDYSVKAVSGGVPVVARYVYEKRAKRLYYAELPFDPYHTEPIIQFFKIKPEDDEKVWPRFYFVDVEDFAFAYGGEEKSDNLESWEDDEKLIPTFVYIRWLTQEGAAVSSSTLLPNFLFPMKVDKAAAAAASTASQPFDEESD